MSIRIVLRHFRGHCVCKFRFSTRPASAVPNMKVSMARNRRNGLAILAPILTVTAAFTVVLLSLDVAMATGSPLHNGLECLREGGFCQNNCPLDKRANNASELCSTTGQFCCFEVPDEALLCQQHGGRCGYEEECRNVQTFGVLDCRGGSTCCLLIF